MGNYVLAYKGGGMAQTDAEREAAMAAWGGWFDNLGDAVAEAGNPFGASMSLTAGSNGAASSGLTGYSVLRANSLDAAAELAKGCPILANGGSVDIYETIEVM
jgi:hypothetical protein